MSAARRWTIGARLAPAVEVLLERVQRSHTLEDMAAHDDYFADLADRFGGQFGLLVPLAIHLQDAPLRVDALAVRLRPVIRVREKGEILVPWNGAGERVHVLSSYDAWTVPLQPPHLQASVPGRDAVVWCPQWLQTPLYACAVLAALAGWVVPLPAPVLLG